MEGGGVGGGGVLGDTLHPLRSNLSRKVIHIVFLLITHCTY